MENNQENPHAFPVADNCPYSGMTLRDYFIAHAPTEPQPWFKPIMPEKPRKLNPSDHLQPDEVEQYRQEDEFAYESENPRIREFAARASDNSDARIEWDNEKTKQVFVQWPAAWADEMMKAREL